MDRNQVATVMGSIAIALICSSMAFADSTMNIQVLKISPQDERAVIKTADGKTKVIKTGDILETEAFSVQSSQFSKKEAVSSRQNQEKNDKTLTVIEIAEGRVVLEERQGNDKETVIIRLKNGNQTVERVRRTAPGNRQQGIAVSTQPSATGKGRNQKSSIN